MTHARLPYKAVGEKLYDARGNEIATFKDWRDADACVEAMNSREDDLEEVEKELHQSETENDRLQEELCDLRKKLRDAKDLVSRLRVLFPSE